MAWKTRIKQWWEGENVVWENDPNSDVIFIVGNTEYHWTAKVVRAIFFFMKNEYKWIIGTTIAIVAIIVGFLKAG